MIKKDAIQPPRDLKWQNNADAGDFINCIR